jgi:hypothetical protein
MNSTPHKAARDCDGHLEAGLQRRVGDVVAIGELIRPVLRITLAQARRHHREAA